MIHHATQRALLVVMLLLAGCTAGRSHNPGPQPTTTAAPTITAAVSATRTSTPARSIPKPTRADQPYCRDAGACVPRALWRPLAIPHLTHGARRPVSRIVRHPAGSPVVRGAGN